MTWLPRTCYLIGCCLLIFTMLQVIPLISALAHNDGRLIGSFLFSIFINGFAGLCLYLGFKGAKRSHSLKVMIFLPIVAYSVTAMGVAIPFVFYYEDTPFGMTLFDGMSIMTTMGASALREGIAESYPLVLWRALASWCGGFGILVVALTFFMRVNVGAMQLYPSNFAKGNKGAALGSVTSVASLLIRPYVIFTSLSLLLFIIAGETVAIALIRALGLVSTSGFVMPGETATVISSVPLQIVYAILMTLALINIDVLYSFWQGTKRQIRTKSIEFRLLPQVLLWGLFGMVAIDFLTSSETNYLDHYFMLVSSMSTMGYSLDWWPTSGPMELSTSVLLIAFVIFGGGVLTTTGGIGLLRLIMLASQSRAEIGRLSHPSGVHKVKLGRREVRSSDMDAVWLLVTGFLMVFIIGSTLFSITGHGIEDSIAMALSSLTTSGGMVQILSPHFPGYSGLDSMDYFLLSFLMLFGRLGVSLMLILGARLLWGSR